MFLWESIAFGPVRSRRLGNSLGINLLPTDKKLCSFDCLYCECGWTLEKTIDPARFYPVAIINESIEQKLRKCHEEKIAIDSITFSGNGEPTLHPDFLQIIYNLVILRDKYYPNSAITVLSNSTMLENPDVCEALLKIEKPILKLDAVTENLFQLINKPTIPISVSEIINGLQLFQGKFIMQTLLFKGVADGIPFDNSSTAHISKWLTIVQKLKPNKVMLYSLDRVTPAQQLEKISFQQMEKIAEKARGLKIKTEVY